MKAVFVKAHEDKGYKVGDRAEMDAKTFGILADDGFVVSASEYDTAQAKAKADEALKAAANVAVDNAIVRAREAGAFAPKEDTATVKATALDLELNKAGLGVAYVQNLPLKHKPAEDLTKRETVSATASDVMVDEDKNVNALVKGFVHASEPFLKSMGKGGIIKAIRGQDTKAFTDAINCSKARGIVTKKLADLVAAGADFVLENVVKAAGTSADEVYYDPNSLVGALNSGLVLQWNLGWLKNQLALLADITTDISNQPVLFEQQVRTRYVKVPGVQLKTTSNAWTGGGGAGTTDVNVRMDVHAGVPLTFNENVLGATLRQLFNEQKTPQLYSLGEYIIYKLLYNVYNGNTRLSSTDGTHSTILFAPNYTSPTLGGTSFNVASATLATFVADLPAAMDLAKFPGGDEGPGDANLQRFVWVHTSIYSGIAADTNFLLNQSIQGIRGQSTNPNLMETGRFERLGNIKFRKSQLVTDQCTVTGTGADGTTNALFVTPGDYTLASKVGFGGTRSALLFVSRVPMDYTKVMPEIPATAAIELVTEPDTGLTFMVVKYLDHGYETANMRVQLMFGTAIGDERQGMLLAVK